MRTFAHCSVNKCACICMWIKKLDNARNVKDALTTEQTQVWYHKAANPNTLEDCVEEGTFK